MPKLGFVLLFFVFSVGIEARYRDFVMFDNYKISDATNAVRFLIEDKQGLIWAGTNKGLYSFDGYSAYPHFVSGERSNSLISCGCFIDEDLLLLGSEFGILLYNIKTEQYEPVLPSFRQDVRAVLKVDEELWIGCFDGLFVYNLTTNKLKELWVEEAQHVKHRIVYTLLDHDGYVYLGSNSRLGRVSIKTKEYEALTSSEDSNAFLVHSILEDQERNCLWVGQGGSLLKYQPDSGTLAYVDEFNVVKSMSLDDDNNLVMGTDNGLCVFNGEQKGFIVHDAREKKSLANNVVWCVYKDSSGNIWLGTDNGISLLPRHRRFNILPIYGLTGIGEGNQFTTIFKDSYNNYWFGGSNGLIMSSGNLGAQTSVFWFKMGGTPFHISHNHVRDIFEDKDQNLWVATDFGLNKLDRGTQSFKRFSVRSGDGKFNSNWAYDLLEDNENRLWIASYNGGVFVVDKKKFNADNTSPVADYFYSTANGLLGNNVGFIVADQLGMVWALIPKLGMNVIHPVSQEVAEFPIKLYTGDAAPNYLMSDQQGFIWVGFTNGVARIDPSSKAVDIINLKGIRNVEVLEMVDVDDVIWVSTNDGIRVVHKEKLTAHHLSHVNEVFSSMYYDDQSKRVIFGGVDVIALADSREEAPKQLEKILISAIYVNNQIYTNKERALSTRYTNKIKLAHNENNLTIAFSDLVYIEENKGSFIYKINENQEWITLPSGGNELQVSELSPGVYEFQIGRLPGNDNAVEVLKHFTIIIAPPWYASDVGKIIYALMVLILAWWVYYFNAAKNRMKLEQLEKEKTLEQAQLKISFFSDVAHEFKTPLSLIIAPLGGLIHGVKEEKNRSALEMIYQNAMKLNALIHQAIDYYRDDSKVNIGLLLSKVEFIEFSSSIFSSFQEGMKDREIDFIFNTNVDHVFINIDLVKMESVMNNLLSNACKFTSKGDSVILSVRYDEQNSIVEIKVSDTGIGIPKQDLPYIFQRFYQSSNSHKHEGKGIGLFLVKNYIELHGGEVVAVSEPEEGTSFIMKLPVVSSRLNEELPALTHTDPKNEKLLILIVEDNVAIAEFIYSTFISDYRCVIANNGKAGLRACNDLNPDLIIADIMMPVMDGLKMAERLRKNPSTAMVPLIFLTAKDDYETELKSIELNVETFITKPFDSAILFSRVNQVLENRRVLQQQARIARISAPQADKTPSQDEKFLAKITRVIEDKIAEPELNVNMLCELTEVSSKQLYRKVKQLTGLSTVDYIKSIRMKKAAMYLANKNFTVAEVMYMVGFSNHSYFAKCFQAKFGLTPRQFMEQGKCKY